MGLFGLSGKATAVFAGIFTLIQGLVWSILTILALLVYDCTINVSNETLWTYRVYLIYLYSQCGSEELEVTTDNGTVTISWPEIESWMTHRTHVWIMVYLSLSLVWVLAALFLVIATFSEIKGRKGVLLRGPWMILTSMFLVFDIATCILYSIDVSRTGSLVDLLRYSGIPNIPDEILQSSITSSIFGNFAAGSSLIATLICCRVIIVWAFNLGLLLHVTQNVREHEATTPATAAPEPRQPYQQFLHKLSTIGPVPDIQWDPYQRKRSDLPVVKPLKFPSPLSERKRKQSDYQQYLFYAKQGPQVNYLDVIPSEPLTPAVGAEPKTTGIWRVETPKLETLVDSNWYSAGSSGAHPNGNSSLPEPDFDSGFSIRPSTANSTDEQGQKTIDKVLY